jgi:hypothetical protein
MKITIEPARPKVGYVVRFDNDVGHGRFRAETLTEVYLIVHHLLAPETHVGGLGCPVCRAHDMGDHSRLKGRPRRVTVFCVSCCAELAPDELDEEGLCGSCRAYTFEEKAREGP